MSGDIVHLRGAGANLPTRQPAEPVLSQPLESAIRQVLNPHPEAPYTTPIPAHVRTEASRAARQYDELCEPVHPNAVLQWLSGLASAVKNPPPRDQFAARATAIAAVVGDMPRAVFSVRTQRESMQRFEFWPSAAEVAALLREHAAPLLARRRALHGIATAPAAEASPRPRSAEAVERIAAGLRGLASEIRVREQPTPAAAPDRAIPAAPLRPDALAALREANTLVRTARALQTEIQAAKGTR